MNRRQHKIQPFFEHIDPNKQYYQLHYNPNNSKWVGSKERCTTSLIQGVSIGSQSRVGSNNIISVPKEEHGGGDEMKGQAEKLGRNEYVFWIVHNNYAQFEI